MPQIEMCNHTFLQELMAKLIPPSQMHGNDRVICCLFFTGIHCFFRKDAAEAGPQMATNEGIYQDANKPLNPIYQIHGKNIH